MAKSTKRSQKDDTPTPADVVESAAPSDPDRTEPDATEVLTSADVTLEPPVHSPADDRVMIPPEATEPDANGAETAEDAQDDSAAMSAVPNEQIASTPAPRRGGVIAPLIGGLVAGAIGFGAATYLSRDTGTGDLAAAVDANTAATADLRAEIGALPPVPDVSGLEGQLATLDTRLGDIETGLAALRDAAQDQLAALDQRVADLEKAPNADGTLSETALAAYERELDTLRAEIAAQQDQMQALADQAQTAIADAEAEAQAIEAMTRAAAARAVLARLRAALDTGDAYAALLPELSDAGIAVPAALTALAEDGVPTNAELAATFPDAARAALAAARSEGVAGEGGGLGAFLRDRFEVRSTVPREGDDPDAILSRAQAAIDGGRLADALAELDALPEVARAEMTDWLAMAEGRRDAIVAVDTLMQTATEN